MFDSIRKRISHQINSMRRRFTLSAFLSQVLEYLIFPHEHPSFKGTLQQLNVSKDTFLRTAEKRLSIMCGHLLKAIVSHRVGNRPGRKCSACRQMTAYDIFLKHKFR